MLSDIELAILETQIEIALVDLELRLTEGRDLCTDVEWAEFGEQLLQGVRRD